MNTANTLIYDLSGQWGFHAGTISTDQEVILQNGSMNGTVLIPGTMDENKKGNPVYTRELERLSRYYTYTGEASYDRNIMIPKEWEGKQISLFMERSRATRLFVNHREILSPASSNILAVPQTYDITDFVNFGEENSIIIIVDNSYPGMPSESILRSSMATDETQTNWNGILGRIELQINEKVRITDIRIYPVKYLKNVKIVCDIINNSENTFTGFIRAKAEGCFVRETLIQIKAGEARTVEIPDYDMGEKIRLWSEFDPFLYTMKISLQNVQNINNNSGSEHEQTDTFKDAGYYVKFGVRSFSVNQDSGWLMCNSREVFLRGESNCAVFPLTGYAPMDETSWEKLFTNYKAYGINAVRFHSWCPPEAAFAVADRMGMYLQPELSCWNHINMFGDEIEKEYYKKEAKAILKTYANHPSFVMLTFGNELHFAGLHYAEELLQELKTADPTRLYSYASNGYYGILPPLECSDFYTAQTYLDSPLRGIFSGMIGFINNMHPGTQVNYEEGAKRVVQGGHPVFSFEVGQFQVFPDVVAETEQYNGILEPRNFHILMEQLKDKNINEETIKAYINSSGSLSRIGYRQEIEAARRTRNMSGIFLLGIQDFSGQGTALVGMMNALGDSKPYSFADSESFRNFFGEQVVLFETEKFCLGNRENMTGKILISNYGAACLEGAIHYRLFDKAGAIYGSGTIKDNCYKNGKLTEAGSIEISLQEIKKAVQLSLELCVGKIHNSYDIWVYPEQVTEDAGEVYITESLDEDALLRLNRGGKVLWSPKSNADAFPNSATGTFTTSFWSSIFVSESQPGTMGLLMNPEHPVFDDFPTEYHTNYQWWPMTKLGRAMILDHLKDKEGRQIKPIVQVVDGFLTLRTMGLLYEASIGSGKLMVSSMGLEQWKDTYPEVKALRNSILNYMNSDQFQPTQVLELEKLVEFATHPL